MIVGVAAAATLVAPVASQAAEGEGKPHAPQRAEVRKCGQLRYQAKKKHKRVGRNICARGVRFLWRSSSGRHKHWGVRPATAREVADEIRRLRAILRPPAPAFTGWAIPSYIVQCESGGRWDARNPSGAYGPYQIMPGTARVHGCDLSTRQGHHECARRIWRTQGPSAWVCA